MVVCQCLSAACMVRRSLPQDLEDPMGHNQEILGDLSICHVLTLCQCHGPILLKDQDSLPEAARWCRRR